MKTQNLNRTLILLCFLLSCQSNDKSSDDMLDIDYEVDFTISSKVYRNGKIKDAKPLDKIYSFTVLDSLPSTIVSTDVLRGFIEQGKLLRYRRKKGANLSNLSFPKKEQLATVDALRNWANAALVPLSEYVEAYQISGEDGRGNVLYTGYYSPVIKVDKAPSAAFPFALYRKPKEWEGAWPTRQEIDNEGVLKGKGLEIAYAKSLLDIYMMQMQGSGYVEFKDGSTLLLSFGGTNRRKPRSFRSYAVQLQRQMKSDSTKTVPTGVISFLKQYAHLIPDVLSKDPAYVFFQTNPKHKNIRGSGNVPLLEDHSIAVDPRYIPLGSCLIGGVPRLDRRGFCTHHEYRLLLAQDVGGAIKGPGHVDLYCGIGAKGKEKTRFKHYGPMWVLKAK